MSSYRFYKIGLGNHIVSPGQDHDFDGDEQALELAKTLANWCAIGVWEGQRFVGNVAAGQRVMRKAER